jgi:DNA-binding IscR family transcriptional regulator
VKGGYSLARESEHISVANIIEAIEGPIAITDCLDQSHRDCLIEHSCPCKTNWERINDAVRSALDTIPLGQMTSGCRFTFPENPSSGKAGSDGSGNGEAKDNEDTHELA